MSHSDTLDLSEAAALLKVDAETARQLAADGKIYGAKIGRSWVFLREDLLDYLRKEIRMTVRQRDKLKRLGGSPWVRRQIDEANG